MARRAAKEAKEQGGPQIAPARPNVPLKKFIKIGRPGYKVTKQRDPSTGQQSLLFQVRNQGKPGPYLGSRMVRSSFQYIFRWTIPKLLMVLNRDIALCLLMNNILNLQIENGNIFYLLPNHTRPFRSSCRVERLIK